MTPTLRRPVAVVLSRFPSVTETFILREVQEMERQGQPVRLVPLLRESSSVVHDEARPWMERALYTPFLAPAILRSNLTAAAHHPTRYLGLLIRLAVTSLTSPRFLLATLALFPKSVHLARLLEAEGIRHVHAHFGSHPATAAFIISMFSPASFSVTLHAHDLFVRRYRPFLSAKLRHAAFVRVISNFNRRTVASLFPRVSMEKVHVVHVGIRTNEYATSDERRGERRSPPARILSVAALRDYKGLSVLVDACARLRDEGFAFRAELVGEGPLRRRLERQIVRADLREHVRLTGAMPQHEVGALLRSRPIFVLPSVKLRDGWMDGIPVALMEAMAAGAPVIGSRLSGIPELVEDGRTGLLVEPGDAEGLALAIRRLAEGPALADRLGTRAREKVEAEFDLKSCTRRLLELVDRHNPPGTDLLVLSSVVQQIGAVAGVPDVVGVAGVHGGADARVLRVLIPGNGRPRRLVIKEHADRPGQSRPPRERARHEYEVLARLASRHGNGEGGPPVPRPIRLEEDTATLVMDDCEGRPLSELLRDARESGDAHARAGAAMRAAGAWLAALQARTSAEAETQAALRAWRRRVETDLENCRTILTQELRSQIAARAAEVPASRCVGRHGDFWPGNLLVAGDRVTALDFEGFGPGLPWEDAAYFLAQAELFFDYPLVRRRFPTLREAFLSGYGQSAPELVPARAAFRAAAVLQILARAAASGKAAGDRRVRRLRRVLEQALA